MEARKLIIRSFTMFLVMLATLPFVAPILSYFGFKKASNLIYEIYSFFCHQKAHRSMFIFDEQCAWCIRDTFIWTSITTVWILLLVHFNKQIAGLKVKTAILLCLPMALDGTIQLIASIVSLLTTVEPGTIPPDPFYESTNLTRVVTGTLFGIGVSLFLFPRLLKELKLMK